MIATREMKPLANGIYVISLHHTWLTRLIVRPPSRSGYLMCSGAALLVLGRWSMATSPIRRIRRATHALLPLAVHPVPLAVQPRRHATRPVKRPRQVLTVDPLHQPEIVCADRSRAAVDRRPADI